MSKFYCNIPNFLTLCNGVSGLIAIILAHQGYFLYAILSICLGTFFDAIDGKAARYIGVSSKMGGELDSLCDCITFGIAPASLMVFQADLLLGRIPVWATICAAIYSSCVIWRLARFNVETTTAPEDHKFFKGIPSPLGAGLVCSGLWFLQIKPNFFPLSFIFGGAVVIGFLMVSRIRFVHLMSYLSESLRPSQFLLLGISLLTGSILLHPFSWPFLFPLFLIAGFIITFFLRPKMPANIQDSVKLAA